MHSPSCPIFEAATFAATWAAIAIAISWHCDCSKGGEDGQRGKQQVSFSPLPIHWCGVVTSCYEAFVKCAGVLTLRLAGYDSVFVADRRTALYL